MAFLSPRRSNSHHRALAIVPEPWRPMIRSAGPPAAKRPRAAA